MSVINGNGRPWHPVEYLAFFKTKPAEIRDMAAKYDVLVGDDPILKKQLDDLLNWAISEARSDEIYNSQD